MTSDNPTVQLLLDSLLPLAKGALMGTIPLTLASFAIGIAAALVVALARLSSNVVARSAARLFISVIRGTPLLVQLFIIFYALPSLGIVIDPFPSAIIAFSLNVAGYAAEAIRAAILSVPRGQWEAAETIGLTRAATLRRVILPQAARRGPPAVEHVHLPGQGHVPGVLDHGRRTAPPGPADRGADV